MMQYHVEKYNKDDENTSLWKKWCLKIYFYDLYLLWKVGSFCCIVLLSLYLVKCVKARSIYTFYWFITNDWMILIILRSDKDQKNKYLGAMQ